MFLLPGALQVDVSVTPAGEFWPRGPSSRLLFGAAGQPRLTPPPGLRDLFGLAIEDVRTARVATERERSGRRSISSSRSGIMPSPWPAFGAISRRATAGVP